MEPALVSELKVSGETDNKVHFCDVRVINTLAPSNRRLTPASCYRRHEREKRRAYDQIVREIEHGTFTPLVFSAADGIGNAATVTYRRLASPLATKRSQSYSRTTGWIRCSLSFSLLRSAITYLRGARSTIGHPAGPLRISDTNLELATNEGRVPDQNITKQLLNYTCKNIILLYGKLSLFLCVHTLFLLNLFVITLQYASTHHQVWGSLRLALIMCRH